MTETSSITATLTVGNLMETITVHEVATAVKTNLGLLNIANGSSAILVNGEPSPDHAVRAEVQLLMSFDS